MEHWRDGKIRGSPVGDDDEAREGKMLIHTEDGGIAITTAKKRKSGRSTAGGSNTYPRGWVNN